MLKEIPQEYVRQIKGEPKRRWFDDDNFDLVIWEDNDGKIIAFQLFYDKVHNQRVLAWKVKSGFLHERVDDGERRPGKYKATPILTADGLFDYKRIAAQFKKEILEIEEKVAAFVHKKLLECPRQLVWRSYRKE